MRPAKTLCATAAVTFSLLVLLPHRPARVPASSTPGPRVRGAIHVHTALSHDGGGHLDDVAGAAAAAGLDFLVITEHNRKESLEVSGRRHGVLLVGGLEKSTDGGHALVLGVPSLPFRLDGDPAAVAQDVADLDGFLVAAHPTSSHPDGTWTARFDGVAGVEVLNFGEPDAWPDGRFAFLTALARYPFDPQGTLLRSLRYSGAAVALWDGVLTERRSAGLLGTDAHGGFPIGGLWVPIPSHEALFRLASQHLRLQAPLTGDDVSDRRLVLDALRLGRGYCAFDSLADASGFAFRVLSGGHEGGMGDSVSLAGEAEIRAEASAPPGTTLILMRNGVEVARGEKILHRTAEAGVYRVEAYLDATLVPGRNRIPWILSNPVYLFSQAELERREARGRLATPPSVARPQVAEIIDAFEGKTLAKRWQIDRSADARATAIAEAQSLRFDFVLGRAPRTYASVCDWGPRDLTSRSALSFRVKADRLLRFDVQVRTADGTASDRVRIWRRSVRADREWRQETLPLGALKTYDRRGGSPDLARVVGVYLHVDESHLEPGSSGTLWIDDVALAP